MSIIQKTLCFMTHFINATDKHKESSTSRARAAAGDDRCSSSWAHIEMFWWLMEIDWPVVLGGESVDGSRLPALSSWVEENVWLTVELGAVAGLDQLEVRPTPAVDSSGWTVKSLAWGVGMFLSTLTENQDLHNYSSFKKIIFSWIKLEWEMKLWSS